MLFKDRTQPVEPRPSERTAPAAPPEKEKTASFIGQTVRLEGSIVSDDDVTVEGRFKGEITLKKSLFVGIEGYVEADIKAAAVTIAGHVLGSVTAENRVRILDSGAMDGSLSSPKIIIAEGGQLRGQVNLK
ncbi:MAG: polymer-forming cytoskeletal protein [Acidobacteriota bacterium]